MTDEIADRILRMLKNVFGEQYYRGGELNKATWERARSQTDVPLCLSSSEVNEDFVAAASDIFRQTLGNVHLEIDDNPGGLAWCLAAGSENLEGNVYFLLICKYYPVATVRVRSHLGCGLGLDEDWQYDVYDPTADPLVNQNVIKLMTQLGDLLKNYRYLCLPYNHPAFQQPLLPTPTDAVSRFFAGIERVFFSPPKKRDIVRDLELYEPKKAWDLLFYLWRPDHESDFDY